MGSQSQFRYAVGAGLVSLVLLAAFQNCGKFTTQDFRDSFSSLCAGQTITKLKALAAAAPVANLKCDDPNFYQCTHRIFRPGVGYEKSSARECAEDGACFSSQVLRFDTASAQQEQNLPEGAFAEGGEYNHEITECEYADAKSEGISILTAEASTLTEAWQTVRRLCTTRTQNAD